MRYLVSLILLMLITPTTMAWVSVGSSPGFGSCDYTTLDDALDDGDPEIRVLDNQAFVENILIDQDVTIRGGFTSCLNTSLNNPVGGNTVIDGSGSSILPTIIIIGLSPIEVTLENVQVEGGATGVSISALGELNIVDSVLAGNSGTNGGGLYVLNNSETESTQVTVRASEIDGNLAENGGGIYCTGENAEVVIDEQSRIHANAATVNGGGMFVTDGCRIYSYSGSYADTSLGILDNQATQHGGGAYVESGALLYLDGSESSLGNSTQPAALGDNAAGANGGGIYATGLGTSVIFIDAYVYNNSAQEDGGAIALFDQALFTASNSGADCWGDYRCSLFVDNTSGDTGFGGHLYMEGGTAASLLKTHFDGGRSDLGTTVYMRDANTRLDMEGSLIYNNGALFHGDYDDQYTIRIFSGAEAELKHVTIADNLVTTAAIGISGGASELTIDNSIVHQAVDVVHEISAPSTSYYCMAVNENASVSGSLVDIIEPDFVDPGNKDYRVGIDFDGIDYCADSGHFYLDIDHQMRGYDAPFILNEDGPFDIGADEFDDSDILFKDGFGG